MPRKKRKPAEKAVETVKKGRSKRPPSLTLFNQIANRILEGLTKINSSLDAKQKPFIEAKAAISRQADRIQQIQNLVKDVERERNDDEREQLRHLPEVHDALAQAGHDIAVLASELIPTSGKSAPTKGRSKPKDVRKGKINFLAASIFQDTFAKGALPEQFVQALEMTYHGDEWRTATILAGGGPSAKRITLEEDQRNNWKGAGPMLRAGVKKLQLAAEDPSSLPSSVSELYQRIKKAGITIDQVTAVVASWGTSFTELN